MSRLPRSRCVKPAASRRVRKKGGTRRYAEAIEACTRIIAAKEHLYRYTYGLRAIALAESNKNDDRQADMVEFNRLTQFDAVSLNMVIEPMSGPDISLRSPAVALGVLRRIQSLQTELPGYIQHASARVLYVNDLFTETVELLEKALSGSDKSFEKPNLMLLAMANYQLGETAKARELMVQADALPVHSTFDFRSRRGLMMLQAECRQLFSQPRP